MKASTLFEAYKSYMFAEKTNPQTPAEKRIFQAMMVLCMGTCMVTIVTSIRQGGFHPRYLLETWYLYPATWGMALLIRYTIANIVSRNLIEKVWEPRLQGVRLGVAKMMSNVFSMSIFMVGFRALLRDGWNGIDTITAVAFMWPIVFCIACTINYFIVGPIVRWTFHNLVAPAWRAHIKQSGTSRVRMPRPVNAILYFVR